MEILAMGIKVRWLEKIRMMVRNWKVVGWMTIKMAKRMDRTQIAKTKTN